MDDLWENAWSDPPPKPVQDARSSIPVAVRSSPLWSSPIAEDKTATAGFHASPDPFTPPSWIAPSDVNSGFGWGSTHHLGTDLQPSVGLNKSPAWGHPQSHQLPEEPDHDVTDVEEKVQGGRNTETEAEVTEVESLEILEEPSKDNAVVIEEATQDVSDPPSPSPIPAHLPLEINKIISPVLPISSNSLQGFETVTSPVHVPSWSPPPSAFHPPAAEETVWRGGWEAPGFMGNGVTSPSLKEDPRDTWAKAQAEQLERDKRVPPQFLDSILAGWTELSWDLYPSQKGKETDTSAAEDDEDIWPEGLERVEGLSDLVQRYAPSEMMQPGLKSLASTSIHKQMHATLKLTRHLPVTRMSPLSHLLSGRSSIAWEKAIRESMRAPEVTDWAALGVQPKELETTAAALHVVSTTEKKGGLMSFFSRTTSISGPSADVIKSATESRSASPSRRSSDVTRVSSPVTSQPSIRGSMDRSRKSITTIPAPPDTQAVPGGIKSPPLYSLEYDSPISQGPSPIAPTPSAVSRFLGRFSKANPGNVSGAHTVSLSDTDLSFLEDVPTMGDEDGEDVTNGLEKILATKPPLPPAKLPAPPAPPPKKVPGRTTHQPLPVTTGPSKTTMDNHSWDVFQNGTSPLPKPLPRSSRVSIPSSSSSQSTPSTPPLLPPPSRVVSTSSRPTTPILAPPRPPGKPASSIANPSLLARRASNAVSQTSSPIDGDDHLGAFSLPPPTPSTPKSLLSPIVTGPSPNSVKTFGLSDGFDDDGFGDFMSVPNNQLLSVWTQPMTGSSVNNEPPSPRITAPDTPNSENMENLFDKAPPLVRRSLSGLIRKVATTQSDRWPRPSSPGVLPPALAPPPQGVKSNGVSGHGQDRSIDIWDMSPSQSKGPLSPLVLLSPPPISNTYTFKNTMPQQSQSGSSFPPSLQSSFPQPPASSARQPLPSVSPLSPSSRTFPFVASVASNPSSKPISLSSSSQSVGTQGRLSESDLSFFEGL
ncbi:hypothetical protein FRB96_004817 [Tulasnella sp. 330]|nr:hypothetical protein FRB96_004817 [Tulasnella sp. 330]